MGRIDGVAEGAREAGYLEADEAPQVLALAKSGQGVARGESFDLKAAVNRWALLATDRKLHAIRLGQLGFKSVKEEALAVPYEELEADFSWPRFRARRKGEDKFWFFDRVPYGSKFKNLQKFLDSRGIPPLPEHPLRDDDS